MSPLTYKQTGVDIAKGNRFIDTVRSAAANTQRAEVLSGIGGFGAVFELPLHRYTHPLLVSATDGVGTKLKLAIDWQHYDGLGIDLVAMCVNDVICQGAEPLFFLDYYATGNLNTDIGNTLINSIAQGCKACGAALIGGETAEMPGLYSESDFDLAGFCVGIVEKSHKLPLQSICAGDYLIGLGASGPHANGYSLIRHIIDKQNIDPEQRLDDKTLRQHLLAPTTLYVRSLLPLLGEKARIKGLAHITGGGLVENVPRMLPPTLQATLDPDTWEWPAIFQWLQTQGNISTEEMYRVFNCGVGMVGCVSPEHISETLAHLEKAGHTAWVLGKITPKEKENAEAVRFAPGTAEKL